MARRSRFQSPLWTDMLSPSPVMPAKASGTIAPRPIASPSTTWREAMDQLPPPPLHFLEDRTLFSEGREDLDTEPGHGGVLSSARPARVVGDVGPHARGGVAMHLSSSPTHARFEDSMFLRSPSSGSPEAWSHGKKKQARDEEALPQLPKGVFVDAVTSQWEAIKPDLSRGTKVAAVASSSSEEGQEWVTVFGFGMDETNLVLREFEKCGPILRYIPGPGTMNWIHLQYQSSYDAQNALRKNGMQLNSALIVGVKPLDRLQRLALTEAPPAPKISSLMPVPPRGSEMNAAASPPPLRPAIQPWPYSSVESNPSGTAMSRAGPALAVPSSLATPIKSSFSKIVDLVFGL